ncbi:RNA-guided endonuclease TnpB family protein [Micromonospora sp. NPDC005299]|uniref:RNA-guided endonuclease TnpB family protein n=1 Tax=Micromonospora sp. NPDC005299 TaxID=3364231 RepID=UPI0036AF3324
MGTDAEAGRPGPRPSGEPSPRRIHKLTTRLAREYGTVVVEDLHIAGMLRNRHLARHIADAGFGELRRQLAYKTLRNGGQLLVADRWYPSSKTCSDCGTVKTKLALSERTYSCEDCGLVLDRDLNAARNLAALAAQVNTAGSGPVAGRGADRKTRHGGPLAVKRQPGIAPADKTGTVSPQGGAVDHVPYRQHEGNGISSAPSQRPCCTITVRRCTSCPY